MRALVNDGLRFIGSHTCVERVPGADVEVVARCPGDIAAYCADTT